MKQSNKEIWLLLDSSGFGGIESHIVQLALGLDANGIRIRVVLMKFYDKHPLINTLGHKGIAVSVIENSYCGLFELAKMFNPGVIHTHGYKAGIIGRCMAKFMNVKVVSTFHAGESLSGKLAAYDWLDRKLAFLADHTYAVSPLVSSRLSSPCEVINNFVDTSKIFLSQGRNIAFVGRMSHEKGPDLYVDLARRHKDITFDIYGDGPLRKSLETSAPSNVIFHGTQNMTQCWNNVGLLLITSRYEGLPMTAIEAMSRGIPVITSNVGALSSLVENDLNGWLVNSGDIQAFSTKLLDWLSRCGEEKNIIKAAAVSTIKKSFSTDAILPKYLKTYQHLCSDVNTFSGGSSYAT